MARRRRIAERRLSYADVSGLARRAAHLFRSLGVAAGDPVIVMLPRVPEWQAVIVGLLEIGALVVPSSTQLRPKDVLYRASHSGAVAVVASHECVEAVDAVRGELPDCEALSRVVRAQAADPGGLDRPARTLLARQPDDASAGRPTLASDPALVYYTSGTTGPPKAVLHDHGYTWTQRYTSRFWHDVRRGRPALDDERHGLGEGGLRRDLRAVERGRRGGALPRPLRAEGRARVPRRDRRRTCSARRRPSSACS